MSALCRRCRRPVEPDAAVCSYCELENPLQDTTRGDQERESYLQQQAQAAAAKEVRLRLFVGIAVVLLVLAVVGAYAWRQRQMQQTAAAGAVARAAAAAPACDAGVIQSQVLSLLIDNALAPLPPAAKSRLPQSAFNVADVVEQPTKDDTVMRRCEYQLAFRPSPSALAVVTTLAADGRISSAVLGDEDIKRAQQFIKKSWINSQQQLEWSLQFEIKRDETDVSKPWVIMIPNELQASLEQAVLSILLATEASAEVP